MKLALILTDSPDRVRDLQRNLSGEFSVIVGRSVAESLDLVQTLPVDLALVDLRSPSVRSDDIPERIREWREHCSVVALLPDEGMDGMLAASYDASLRTDSTPYEISAVLDRVMEHQRLLEELGQQREEIRRLRARSERLQAARAPFRPVDKIIKAFSRALSSGFDQERLLGLFLDTVVEMMHVSKVSVLLHDGNPGEYRVRCYRGLRPDVAEGLRLRSSAGLAAWLAREGCIMTRELADDPGVSAELRKEMDALQAMVSIPMLCGGVLVGILNLNNRVTGSPFQEDELETLFTLASHMAVAVRDMGALRQVLHEKTYTEQVVAAMSAGVITINDREEVVMCNQRAAEILGKAASEVLHQDLRTLPSPLGDLLYEVMCSGDPVGDKEVLLLPARTPLIVNAYPLADPSGDVLGSALVLNPRPAFSRKDIENLASAVQHLQAGIGSLAQEMRQSLGEAQAAIQTIPEGPLDPVQVGELRDVLAQELSRLTSLVEKLAATGQDGEGRRERPIVLGPVEQPVESPVSEARRL